MTRETISGTPTSLNSLTQKRPDNDRISQLKQQQDLKIEAITNDLEIQLPDITNDDYLQLKSKH